MAASTDLSEHQRTSIGTTIFGQQCRRANNYQLISTLENAAYDATTDLVLHLQLRRLQDHSEKVAAYVLNLYYILEQGIYTR